MFLCLNFDSVLEQMAPTEVYYFVLKYLPVK